MDQQANNINHDSIHKTTFRGRRARYRRGSPADLGRTNASACVTACFDRLIPSVEDACRQLQQPEHQQTRLWDLYCCDSINCGVYIGSIGQSPNVDLIINECQNIGFYAIEDPGPPAINYCSSSVFNTITTSSPPHTLAIVPTSRTQSTSSIVPHTIPPTHTSKTPVPLAHTSTIPSSSTSINSPIPTNTNSTGLPAGAKAAIIAFSVIVVLAIIAFLAFIFRRRRKGSKSSSPGQLLMPYDNRSNPEPHSNSQTPLITPSPSTSSRSARLAPPAKLSERKYLQQVHREGPPRPSVSVSVGDQTVPSSRISTSTQSRPMPLNKRRATANSTRAPINKTISTRSRYPESSVYSSSSGPDTSTMTIESNKASSIHSGSATVIGASTPPLSSTRFPRLHDGSLELTVFPTPAGPPPNRALPAPPLNHPNSPTFSALSVSPRSPTFPAPALIRGDSPGVPTQQGKAALPASISAKELRDLTESYAREAEARESWGSWSGVGGGGPGVTGPGRKRSRGKRGSAEKKGGAKVVTVPQELDLEKLSGRY